MQVRKGLGAALVVGGLLLNPWSIAYVATGDRTIDVLSLFTFILFISVTCIVGGLQLLLRWVERLSWDGRAGLLRGISAAAIVGLLGAGGYWRIATYNERHNHIALVATGHERVTPQQQQWAQDFYQRSLTAALKNGWFDIDRAFAQGFQADRVNGTHYPNLQNMFDDVILDPERPEWLIYNDMPDGKVLMGFMYFTRELNEVGPTPAGPLAQWHFHPYVTPRCAVKGLWTVGRPTAMASARKGLPSVARRRCSTSGSSIIRWGASPK